MYASNLALISRLVAKINKLLKKSQKELNLDLVNALHKSIMIPTLMREIETRVYKEREN